MQNNQPAVIKDNQGTIAMSKNPVYHRCTKHTDIRRNFIREAIQYGVIDVQYCPTEDMLANILTKPLSKGRFAHQVLCAKL